MPIEVRELIIKATITQDGGDKGKMPVSSASPGNDTSPREEILNMSAEKMLEIIKEKNER